VRAGDRCGEATNRDGCDGLYEKKQKLTTVLYSSLERPEMVWRRRSAAAGLQLAELVGDDWELPSSFSLTRRRRRPWRSFGDSQTDSRWSLATARVSARARVSVPAKKPGGRRRAEVLGLIHCGGATFIDH
jgi:hypothetical protein